MMKKVANIVFNPFVNDSRVLKETLSLANNGYEVEVIAHSNEGLKKYEDKGNYKIHRFSFLNRKITKGNIAKLKAYLKYTINTIKHCKTFDYLHCNDLIALPIGVAIKLFYNKNAKIIYDAHEYETQVNGLSGTKQKLVGWLEKIMIKHADAVIAVSDSIANEYAKLYNIPKPHLVLNAPPYQQIPKQNIFREKFDISQEKTIFLYQGGLGAGRGIEMLLETFQKVEDKNNIIVFMGYGDLEKEVQTVADQYENIYYHPAVSPEVLLNYTSSADYGILFYENSCLNHNYCSPNKVFEYLMAGIPVIVSNLYEMKKIVHQYELGYVAKENNTEGFLETLKTYEQGKDFSQNIKKVQHIFNWENQEKKLLKLYNEL